MARYSIAVVAFLASFLAVSSTPTPVTDNCVVTSFDAVEAALAECTTLVVDGITVPAGQVLFLKLKEGASLTLKGTITFEYSEWKGPLMYIQGKRVTVNGEGSTLDGLGAKYWDGKGSNGGKSKPKFLRIKTTEGSTISHLKLLNCPVQCMSFNHATDTVLDDITIDVSAGDAGALGHNTDGFDLSDSSGITIQNSVVKNQDDCVAVNQGSNYLFRNIECSGGHGLSLSVGQSSSDGVKNTVQNVTFTDCTVSNSRNGIHVKTHTDAGTGAISDVTYKNIKFSGLTNYGINVQEDYKGGKSTGVPKGNIPIKNLVLNSISGSMSGGSESMPVYILCGDGGCSDWPWSGVSISNGKKSNECNFSPNGFSCN